MPGLSTDLVVHKLPTDPAFPPVQQKLRNFKTNMSVKIKEEITKQLGAKVIRVTRYPTWLANVVPVPKKDDDVIIKSKKQSNHVKDLRKFFQRLRRYNLKLNPAKYAFGVPSGKLLGFVVSRHGIELDPSKIKVIQELPPPKNKTEVMSLLGRLNYISRFIVQLTTTCELIFKMLKKNVAVKWTDECQEAFDKIKRYLSNPSVLVPPELGRPLVLYLIVLDNSFCSEPMPMGGLAKWQILLTEFDIIYVTWTAIKAQALADHLAENLVDDEYEPLKTYFPDEEVMCVDEVDRDEKPGWKLFFDGASNMKGVGIGVVLISKIGQHYLVTVQLRFYCTNNMVEYEACILGLRLDIDMGVQEILVLGDSDLSVEFRHIPGIHNEIVDALATLSSMLHHPNKAYVNPVHIQVHDQHVYCNVVEEEIDGKPWFHDIKEYIKSGAYLVHATSDQKRTIRRLASGLFLSGGILYKRTLDLGLLRCIDAKDVSTIMAEGHSGFYGPHMNSYVLAKKILRAVGATPYLLVYGTEAVIPAEVEIPSLQIVVEAEIDDDE
ncbi:uncharacterized protein [Nicotiana sylvestris]|uniref:uncharacterized protein n=1 Tax=Nicotiana sylvestris TaxID=4096 RepID=UPI00388C99B3